MGSWLARWLAGKRHLACKLACTERPFGLHEKVIWLAGVTLTVQATQSMQTRTGPAAEPVRPGSRVSGCSGCDGRAEFGDCPANRYGASFRHPFSYPAGPAELHPGTQRWPVALETRRSP